MNLRKAAKQALEAMLNFPDDISDDMFESIIALKAALAETDEVAAAVAAEREACARLCDGWTHADGDQCAEAIRARSEL